ncbi:MAG: FHA domain-containing protein, partial [Phycisphaerales bacterium]|nr:FHA domain-containing protein [Phycisphaerales bacterium]
MQLRATTGHTRPVRLSDDPVTIGRHPSCTIRSADDQLSRMHCVIEQNGSGWVVRDLDSRNGTKLNGIRIDESPLGVGDIVKAGGLEFRVEEVPDEGEVGGAHEPW